MKKYRFIALLLLGLPWPAARAQQATEVPPPPVLIGPLRLEKISFSRVGGQCKDGPCVAVRINSLKVVSAENVQAAAKISAAIADWALRLNGASRFAKSPQEVLQQFVDSYWEMHRYGSRADPTYSIPYYLTRTVEITYQSARVLSLSFLEESYWGGAHPNGTLTYANFRPATGERMRLTDIFEQGYAASLNAVAERRFRELKGLSPEASLKEAYFRFPNDQFRLNENFSICADGLTFFYNSYEITAWAFGPTELLLPYADIRNLLRPDAVIP